jgi:energy-converting hydrogenase Eha subunit A
MKINKYLVALVISISLSLIIFYDFIQKNVYSYDSNSTKEYLNKYIENNIFGVENIYVATMIIILSGVISILLLLYSKKVFYRKYLFIVLIAITGAVTFLNVFSLL